MRFAAPAILADGAGGAVVAWVPQDRSGLVAQRFDSEGRRLWGTKGIVLEDDAALEISDIALAQAGESGTIVSWTAGHGGVPVSRSTLSLSQDGTRGIAGPSESVMDNNSGEPDEMEQSGSTGTAGTAAGSRAIDAEPGAAGPQPPVNAVGVHSAPASIPDGAGGGLAVSWSEGGRLLVHRTDADGNTLWTTWAAIVTKTVRVENFDFSPSSLSIATGDVVKWVWEGGSHTTTSGTCSGACNQDGLWNSGIRTSGSFSRTFQEPGTFHYFCIVHGSMMQGSVTATGEPFPFTCAIKAVPQTGENQLTVAFSGTLSGTEPYTVNWDFGDGTSSTDLAPTHTYTADGLFSSSLTAHDANGKSCSDASDITVTPCVGRTISAVSVKERASGLVILKVTGIGFKKGDVVQIDSGAGFVDVPLTKVKAKKLTCKGVESVFPNGSAVQVRVRKSNNCASSSLPATR
jgi:plastocyanin